MAGAGHLVATLESGSCNYVIRPLPNDSSQSERAGILLPFSRVNQGLFAPLPN